MKNKNILIMVFAMVFLFGIMGINGEVFLWNTVNVDNVSSTVNYHAYYQFEDTSVNGFGTSQDTPITIWYTVEPLPLSLGDSFGTNVDWCNLTIKHFKNIYGTNFIAFEGFFRGELLNTTTEIQNIYFENTPLSSEKIIVNLRDNDNLNIDMKCHYTDVRSLYYQNILVGRFATYMSSYACSECTQYSLEELSNEVSKIQNSTQSQLSIYDSIQKVVSFNYQGWLILSWIIKIGMIFVAIALIFGGVYYFYIFFSNIGKELR